jgi:hypothetical protein
MLAILTLLAAGLARAVAASPLGSSRFLMRSGAEPARADALGVTRRGVVEAAMATAGLLPADTTASLVRAALTAPTAPALERVRAETAALVAIGTEMDLSGTLAQGPGGRPLLSLSQGDRRWSLNPTRGTWMPSPDTANRK